MAINFFTSEVYAASGSLVATKGCGSSGLYTNGILKGLPCNSPISDLGTLMTFVKNILTGFILPITGTVFVIMIILGGLLYITSSGNQQRIDSAKKTLTAAIIGLIIVTLAYTLIAVFARLLGGSVS